MLSTVTPSCFNFAQTFNGKTEKTLRSIGTSHQGSWRTSSFSKTSTPPILNPQIEPSTLLKSHSQAPEYYCSNQINGNPECPGKKDWDDRIE